MMRDLYIFVGLVSVVILFLSAPFIFVVLVVDSLCN